MNLPSLKTVKSKMKNAKEVRCLDKGIIVDISFAKDFVADERENKYTTPGGAVTIYKDGEYAAIVSSKVKKCQCVDCNCADKKKLIKRRQNKG